MSVTGGDQDAGGEDSGAVGSGPGSGGAASGPKRWRNRDVWSISLSACLADLGYQSVLAAFPLFLVLEMHEPVWLFGLASALSYGGGAVFSWLGGRVGDRIGHRRLALMGNAAIPLLSLSALVANPAVAIGLLSGGWWARNLRSPSRRVMLTEAVPLEEDRSAAFGFLHGLDVGGGMLAACYVLVALAAHMPYRWLFLLTVIPLGASTFALSRATTGAPAASGAGSSSEKPLETSGESGRRSGTGNGQAGTGNGQAGTGPRPRLPGAGALLAATALYGFTSYSVGFPVLTLAEQGRSMLLGVTAFLVFQGVSATTGYALGAHLGLSASRRFGNLAVYGYLMAGLGAGLLAASYGASLGTAVSMIAVALIGFALGVIETLEPSLMSVLRPGGAAGRGFGALSASRSFGVFAGNLAMGLLYGLGASWAYGYAAVIAVVASLVVVAVLPAVRRAEQNAAAV